MNTRLVWKEKMNFVGETGEVKVSLDSKPPLGSGNGFTPKELVAVGLSGCTAMDVIALLKKFKEPVESFEVDAEVESTTGAHPIVFRSVLLRFKVEGQVNSEKLIEAVQRSQTQYCGVSAMLSRAVQISYEIYLNDKKIHEAVARFDQQLGG